MAQIENKDGHAEPVSRSPMLLALWLTAGFLAFAGFVALGTWQVHRRVWKLALIERVDHRVSAAALPPPARAQWPGINARDDEYLKLCLTGAYLHDRETLVEAATRLGSGYWVMTPLRATDGDIVLINRGFVGPDQRRPATRGAGQIAGQVKVCGLLRTTEPRGGFLRRNDPADGRWYSRDVAAIAAAQGLPAHDVAPYFVDADATPNPGGWPVGGLTVIHFYNNHLVYAVTWYALALMVLGAGIGFVRDEWRLRQPGRMFSRDT